MASRKNNEKTIQIHEDDLIDRRCDLKRIYKRDFFDFNNCLCDAKQSIFVYGGAGAKHNSYNRLSKSLQRKLVNLHDVLLVAANNGLNGEISSDVIYKKVKDFSLQKVKELDIDAKETLKLHDLSQKNIEYKSKLFRLLRSIIERILIDAYQTCDQYSNQLEQSQQLFNNPTTRLWSEVRKEGFQFLGPQMQDDLLKIILHAMDVCGSMPRRNLILYVVYCLKKQYPETSKTSVGHVIQLLYKTGCFKMEKRDGDSTLMELKKDFSRYQSLRRQHDSKIISIALNAGIRMSPEQWSHKLFGDATHKSDMQSIIDTLQSELTVEKLISDFYEKLNSTIKLEQNFDLTFRLLNKSIFEIKSDFEYFDSIYFEKKQPPKKSTRIIRHKANLNSNTNFNEQNDLVNTLMSSEVGGGGSGCSGRAESILDSEECYDLRYNNDDDIEYEENYQDSLFSDSYGADDDEENGSENGNLFKMRNPNTGPLHPPEQKISWIVLTECLKRTITIMDVYIKFLSEINITTNIARHTNLNAAANKAFNNNKQAQQNNKNNNFQNNIQFSTIQKLAKFSASGYNAAAAHTLFQNLNSNNFNFNQFNQANLVCTPQLQQFFSNRHLTNNNNLIQKNFQSATNQNGAFSNSYMNSSNTETNVTNSSLNNYQRTNQQF
jgi:hypothetical protein